MSEAIQAVTHCTVNNDVPENAGETRPVPATHNGWQDSGERAICLCQRRIWRVAELDREGIDFLRALLWLPAYMCCGDVAP